MSRAFRISAILLFAATLAAAQQTMKLDVPLAVHSQAQLHAGDVAISASRAKVEVNAVEEVAPSQVNGEIPIFVVLNRINIGSQRIAPMQQEIVRWMVEALKQRRMICVVTLDMGGYNIILQPRVPARIALLAIERYNKEAHVIERDWHSGESPATPEEEGAVNATLQSLRIFSTPRSAQEFVSAAHAYAAELSALAGTFSRIPGRKPVLLIEQLMPFALDESDGRLSTGLNTGMHIDITGGFGQASGVGTTSNTEPDAALTSEMQQAIEHLNEAHVSMYRVGAVVHTSEPNAEYLARATGGEDFDNPFDISGHVREMMNDFGPYWIAHATAVTAAKLDWHPLTVKIAGEKLHRAPTGFFSVQQAK